MKLLIDIGNSRIKWTLCNNLELNEIHSFEYKSRQRGRLFDKAWKEIDKPESVWVSNVSGEKLRDELQAWCESCWQINPCFISPESDAYGVKNAYDDVKKLGTDRWASLIAVHHTHSPKPACIVDCGTAVTIDVLNANGQHRGGLIIPGLALMRRSLEKEASGIKLDVPTGGGFLAGNTSTAVIAGTLYTLLATIDRISIDVLAETGVNTCFIISGGDARTLQPLLEKKWEYRPHLVLEGLAVISSPKTSESEVSNKAENTASMSKAGSQDHSKQKVDKNTSEKIINTESDKASDTDKTVEQEVKTGNSGTQLTEEKTASKKHSRSKRSGKRRQTKKNIDEIVKSAVMQETESVKPTIAETESTD